MAGPNWPKICEYDSNTWAVVYTDLGGSDGLDLATSPKTDHDDWTEYGSNPILEGVGGEIRGCGLLKDPDDGEFKVLYDIVGSFCLATGTTLESLTKYSASDDPVFSGQGSGWEEYVRHPSLYKVGSTYHMYYDGREGSAKSETGAIGHATSSDLITWTRDAKNPILVPRVEDWEDYDLTTPCFAVINNIKYLFYAGYGGSGAPDYTHKIGYAITTDYSTFHRCAGPIIDIGGGGAWDDASIQGPTIMIEADGTVNLYFAGTDATDHGLGYATLD